MLINAAAALNTNQSEKDLRRELNKLKSRVQRSKMNLLDAYEQDFGESFSYSPSDIMLRVTDTERKPLSAFDAGGE